MKKNDILEILKYFEKRFNIIRKFKFKNTTVWINIKNYIYEKSLKNDVKKQYLNRSFFNKEGMFLVLISLKNYFKYLIKREEKILFVGAGSGLFIHNDKIMDSYLPLELKNKNFIYMLSADYPKRLIKYKDYIEKNNIIIYSFLLAPLKIMFTKLIYPFINFEIDKKFFNILDSNDIKITKKEIKYIYTKFLVSYYLYKLFFFFFKIKKAYIVSAYSNTELISVLKEKKVEIIEIQHGIVGPIHRGYNYAVRDKLLPTPDKIYVYSDFWKRELLIAGYFKKEQIEVKGRIKDNLINKNLVIYDNRYIVFTGQGLFYDEIKNLFIESKELLDKLNIKLLYLPHPNENYKSIEKLKAISSDNIIILENKLFSTEQYIYNSLAHISIYSSCHFDALFYKNKTYVFDIMKNNPINYYIKNYKEKFILIKNILDIEELYKC